MLKKAYLQQEQTIFALQAQLQTEQTKASTIHLDYDTQSKNIEVDNLKNKCEAKDLEMLNLKTQVQKLEDEQRAIEKENVEMTDGTKAKLIKIESASIKLQEELLEKKH